MQKEQLITLYDEMLTKYQISNGVCINQKNKEGKSLSYNGYPVINNYRTTHPSLPKYAYVKIHRLVAYKKYGVLLLEDGIIARHLDDNKLNFKEDNITIGTKLDNAKDAIKNNCIIKKKNILTTEDINTLQKLHTSTGGTMTNKKLALKFNVNIDTVRNHMKNYKKLL